MTAAAFDSYLTASHFPIKLLHSSGVVGFNQHGVGLELNSLTAGQFLPWVALEVF